jgi:polyadenylate-binding protein
MGPGGVMPPQGQMGGQRGGRGGRGGMGQRGGRPNVGGPRGPRDNQGQQPQGQPQGQPAPYATVVAADKPQQPQAQATPAPANEQTLTAAQLASYSPEQQRVMLGERLYALVLKHLEKANENTQLAGKITGMLLDSDQVEGLIQLLGDETALSQQIDDGLNLLKEHQTAETQAQ